MKYCKGKIENNRIVLSDCKEIDQSKLLNDCWLIQFEGLVACNECKYLNTKDCGGKRIRKQLLKLK